MEESKYSILKTTNLLEVLKKRKREGVSYRFLSDDWVQIIVSPDDDSPWLSSHATKERKCLIWHNVYFGMYNVVPTPCLQHCFKVCITQRYHSLTRTDQLTFRDVMEIADFQEEFEWPSKVGMDRRDWTTSIWGAYWYCDSLEQAKEVRQQVQNGLSEDLIVEIKRGCTEMELNLGSTEDWDVYDPRCQAQKDLEGELNEWIYPDVGVPEQYTLIKRDIIIRFMYWAHKHGDMSYRDFMNEGEYLEFEMPGGKRPFKPSTKY